MSGRRVQISVDCFGEERTESRMRAKCTLQMELWLNEQRENPEVGSIIAFEIVENKEKPGGKKTI